MSLDPGRAHPLSTDPADRVSIELVVNDRTHRVDVEPRTLLSDLLRGELKLTGTHVGCEHGVCGACTVRVEGELVRSCLMLGAQADGARIETIESLASGDQLHPVQEAFREAHGLQCGFCTPGLVLAVRQLLEEQDDPSEELVREYLSGNICRCTGYVGVVDAVRVASEKLRGRNGGAGREAEGGAEEDEEEEEETDGNGG